MTKSLIDTATKYLKEFVSDQNIPKHLIFVPIAIIIYFMIPTFVLYIAIILLCAIIWYYTDLGKKVSNMFS